MVGPRGGGTSPGRRLKASKHLEASLEAAHALLDGYHLDPLLVRHASVAPQHSVPVLPQNLIPRL